MGGEGPTCGATLYGMAIKGLLVKTMLIVYNKRNQ